MKSGSDPYTSVFTSGATDVSGLELSGLTIDHNVAGNGLISEADCLTSARATLIVQNGTSVRVHHNHILNSSAVNNIVLNGMSVSAFSVTDNLFTVIGDDPNHIAHDASVIYVHATDGVVARNTIVSAGVDTPAAITAIEVHGSRIIVSDNVITDFRVGANITGIFESDSQNLLVRGNSISGAAAGIVLWSDAHGAHITGYGLDGVDVSHNLIRLAQTGSWTGSIGMIGVGLEPNGALDASHLTIAHNTIISPDEASDLTANTASLAIGWYSVEGKALVDSQIVGNLISGFPMAGIRLSCAIQNVTVRDNRLVNVGSTLDTDITAAYRTPIFIGATTISGLDIAGNVITDDHATTRNVYALYLAATTSAVDWTVGVNPVHITGATKTAFVADVVVDGGTQHSQRQPYGTWAHKPTTSRSAGQMYFATDDNTNGSPRWWNATAWVDSAGTVVA